MKFIPNGVSSTVAKTLFKTQKHSPTLLFAGGVVGVVATAVLASRATLRVDEILAETQSKLDDVNTVVEMERPDFTPQQGKAAKATVYLGAAFDITKLYGPAILVGVVSVGMLAGSHSILTKRNAALTAAYATVEKGFKEYRQRVVEDLGEEKDKQYLHDVKKVKYTETDPETGKKTQVEKKHAHATSPYGVIFHDGNPNWHDVPEYNFMFIRGIQNMANDRLRAQGFLFLNDVLKDLGFQPTRDGQMVGWRTDGDGDGYIDFSLFDDQDTLRIWEYMTNREGELYLDFNVDGLIQDKI